MLTLDLNTVSSISTIRCEHPGCQRSFVKSLVLGRRSSYRGSLTSSGSSSIGLFHCFPGTICTRQKCQRTCLCRTIAEAWSGNPSHVVVGANLSRVDESYLASQIDDTSDRDFSIAFVGSDGDKDGSCFQRGKCDSDGEGPQHGEFDELP